MDISPQRVRTAEFKTVKRGLDPDEVRDFLANVAAELERAQNQSTAMEARARAAVARLQEISDATPAQPADAVSAQPTVSDDAAPDVDVVVAASVDQSETISRTLLLAQRTADTAVAEAQAEAQRITTAADDEATKTLDSTREMSSRLLEEAREEARRAHEAERVRVEALVNSLVARRDFLESDVDHLESFLVDERNRLRDAASSIIEVVERVPSGLGEVRRPLLSASEDDGSEFDGDADDQRADRTQADRDVEARDDDDHAVTGQDHDDDRDRDLDRDLDPGQIPDGASTVHGPPTEPLLIRSDIADEGPQGEHRTEADQQGFSYDDTTR